MNKPKYVKIMCFCLLTVGVCHYCAQSQPAQAESQPASTSDVGRDNPFARLPRKKPTSQNILPSSIAGEETPELFIKTVTLKFLDARSLEQVIGSFCSSYGSIATDSKTNSLIICDTKEYLERILAQIRRAEETMTPLSIAKGDQITPDLFFETVTLKFLDAANLMKAISKMSSPHGSMAINQKNNSLIICDTNEYLPRILAEIRKADRTPAQLLIEAVIVDVQLKDDTEIGVNWDLLLAPSDDLAYRQNFTSRLGSTIEDADTIGDASAFVTTGTGGDFSLISGTIKNVGTIRHVVHMLQQKKDVEILASPRVMVLSGQSATIEAIEEIPYRELTETAAGGELASVAFKQVGIKMTVTATLTDGNDIMLTVAPEQNVNTSVFGIENIPIIDTRKAQTTVLLKDGQVIVMGGLRRKEKTRSRDQIPLLGDLPLVGFLFGKDKTIIKHSELIVFLSPHIYKGEPIPEDEMAKYNEIRERSMLSMPDKNERKNVLELLDE